MNDTLSVYESLIFGHQGIKSNETERYDQRNVYFNDQRRLFVQKLLVNETLLTLIQRVTTCLFTRFDFFLCS